MSILPLLMAVMGNGRSLDVADVFSATAYTGTAAAQDIVNGVDGDLVLTKSRNGAQNHQIYDIENGVNKSLASNNSDVLKDEANSLTAFNSNGFSLGSNSNSNSAVTGFENYISWAFKKAPKFLDIVTWTGNSATARQISHALSCIPGLILVKCLNSAEAWAVYHVGAHATNPEQYWLRLDSSTARAASSGKWYDTAPTDSVFTVGNDGEVNASGNTYIAYLFAHDPSETGMIQCGSYTGNGSSTGPVIDLSWRPQFVLIKRATNVGNWNIFDTARGLQTGADQYLVANSSNPEGSADYVDLTSTGFQPTTNNSDINASGDTYIYMAIKEAA